MVYARAKYRPDRYIPRRIIVTPRKLTRSTGLFGRLMRQPNDIKHAKRESTPWMRARHRPTSRDKLPSRGLEDGEYVFSTNVYSAAPPFVAFRQSSYSSPTWNKSRVVASVENGKREKKGAKWDFEGAKGNRGTNSARHLDEARAFRALAFLFSRASATAPRIEGNKENKNTRNGNWKRVRKSSSHAFLTREERRGELLLEDLAEGRSDRRREKERERDDRRSILQVECCSSIDQWWFC